jgi:acetoacetyl-CoA synthetase
MKTPLWQPSKERIASSNMSAFMSEVGKSDCDYQAFWQWSVDQPGDFWSSVWSFCELQHLDGSLHPVIQGEGMRGTRWFPELKLNFADNLLKYASKIRDFEDSDPFDKAAVIFRDERGNRREINYLSLYRQVVQCASSLRKVGVTKGDRVAGFMPNVPETLVAMLATASLGAVWSSCSPDFGLQGVLDRFGQIEPKVLLTTDGYYYGGKCLDSLPRVKDILEHLSCVEQLVVVDYVSDKLNLDGLNVSSTQVASWHEFLDDSAEELIFEPVSFDHPLYIMYSSGTTGVPKCMVHSVGGTLLQHAKELVLHTDLKPADTLFYYTTCGWMMWNWLVSGLMTGATIVLYDGSPFHPSADVLWDMAEQESVSIFGTSAKYIAALEKAGVKPTRSHNLKSLKSILSTGSPLSHESFDYVYRDIKQDVCLSSISGGTDIISCFVLGNPNLPVWRGELQCLGLGMAVNIYNDQGQAVQNTKGELVCEQPFPSMPTGFWNDPEGTKFHKAYFAHWDGVWAHGDYGELVVKEGRPNATMVIHGRSDAVLNPGGVRIGTAEIYRQVEKVDAVVESIAVGQQWKDDVRVILFVVLREGVSLTTELVDDIKQVIRSNTTPRHVPAKVIQVADIPRTISGKIVELAVRNVIHGEPVKNTDALKNPEALEAFRSLKALQD